jgi:hypothetical protein
MGAQWSAISPCSHFINDCSCIVFFTSSTNRALLHRGVTHWGILILESWRPALQIETICSHPGSTQKQELSCYFPAYRPHSTSVGSKLLFRGEQDCTRCVLRDVVHILYYSLWTVKKCRLALRYARKRNLIYAQKESTVLPAQIFTLLKIAAQRYMMICIKFHQNWQISMEMKVWIYLGFQVKFSCHWGDLHERHVL